MKRKYIEIGKITRPHGVNGAVRTEAWCDSPSVLAGMKAVFVSDPTAPSGYRAIKVVKASVQKDRVLLSLEGISSVEQAERLRDTVLFADREDIPVKEGAYLIDDLKGLPLIDVRDGRVYGTLHDVLQGAAGDLYEVSVEGGTVLIPAVREFVKSIEPEKGIFIAPIPGMFDED